MCYDIFMKLTNRLGLPQPIVDAVKNDGYTRGDADISVTELLDPPMLRALKVKHEEELEEDVSDRIFSLLGQTMHGILERSETTGIAERRLSINVEGWNVSGGMDRYVSKSGLLQDYKLTTIWKTKGKKIPEEWAKQLNIYAEMLRQNGDAVNKLEIVAIYRDWSKAQAEREADYPQQQVEVIDIPLIESDVVMSFITERVRLHQEASKGNYSPCTKEERWEKDEKYAVMKGGQKRAVKLFDNQQEAINFVGWTKNYTIEHRSGTSVRCENYCAVKNFCKYYQENIKKPDDGLIEIKINKENK